MTHIKVTNLPRLLVELKAQVATPPVDPTKTILLTDSLSPAPVATGRDASVLRSQVINLLRQFGLDAEVPKLDARLAPGVSGANLQRLVDRVETRLRDLGKSLADAVIQDRGSLAGKPAVDAVLKSAASMAIGKEALNDVMAGAVFAQCRLGQGKLADEMREAFRERGLRYLDPTEFTDARRIGAQKLMKELVNADPKVEKEALDWLAGLADNGIIDPAEHRTFIDQMALANIRGARGRSPMDAAAPLNAYRTIADIDPGDRNEAVRDSRQTGLAEAVSKLQDPKVQLHEVKEALATLRSAVNIARDLGGIGEAEHTARIHTAALAHILVPERAPIAKLILAATRAPIPGEAIMAQIVRDTGDLPGAMRTGIGITEASLASLATWVKLGAMTKEEARDLITSALDHLKFSPTTRSALEKQESRRSWRPFGGGLPVAPDKLAVALTKRFPDAAANAATQKPCRYGAGFDIAALLRGKMSTPELQCVATHMLAHLPLRPKSEDVGTLVIPLFTYLADGARKGRAGMEPLTGLKANEVLQAVQSLATHIMRLMKDTDAFQM